MLCSKKYFLVFSCSEVRSSTTLLLCLISISYFFLTEDICQCQCDQIMEQKVVHFLQKLPKKLQLDIFTLKLMFCKITH